MDLTTRRGRPGVRIQSKALKSEARFGGTQIYIPLKAFGIRQNRVLLNSIAGRHET
jgi:hypothetical protein